MCGPTFGISVYLLKINQITKIWHVTTGTISKTIPMSRLLWPFTKGQTIFVKSSKLNDQSNDVLP
jgi:hypothetical protein